MDVSTLPLKDLTEAFINVSDQDVVRVVFLTARSYKFDSFLKSLSAKYEVISKDTPSSGDKGALFKADNCSVFLSLSRGGAELTIDYSSKEFTDMYKAKKQKEEENAL